MFQRREGFGARKTNRSKETHHGTKYVLYYSMYGHIEIMAKAGVSAFRLRMPVVMKRVPIHVGPKGQATRGELEQEGAFATGLTYTIFNIIEAIIFGLHEMHHA